MAQGSWAPKQFPIRKPTDTKQVIGKLVNPPRTQKVGGVGEARVFNTEKQQGGTSKLTGKGPVSDRGRGR